MGFIMVDSRISVKYKSEKPPHIFKLQGALYVLRKSEMLYLYNSQLSF
jgi:hypothetical protein